MKNKLGLIIGMGTDCKSALSGCKSTLSYMTYFFTYPRDRAKLWEVYNDGSEVLRAVYSKDKFIKK
jgi:hypothetical protein